MVKGREDGRERIFDICFRVPLEAVGGDAVISRNVARIFYQNVKIMHYYSETFLKLEIWDQLETAPHLEIKFTAFSGYPFACVSQVVLWL